MRISRPSNRNWTSHTSPLIRSTFPIFLTLENRKNILERPALGTVLGPAIVIALQATCPDHCVDACSATEYMTESHVELPIVQLRKWNERESVVERTADVVKPDARVCDGRRVVGSSRFDDEDLRAGSGQLRRENASGRTRSHHDKIILPFMRYVVHFQKSPTPEH